MVGQYLRPIDGDKLVSAMALSYGHEEEEYIFCNLPMLLYYSQAFKNSTMPAARLRNSSLVLSIVPARRFHLPVSRVSLSGLIQSKPTTRSIFQSFIFGKTTPRLTHVSGSPKSIETEHRFRD